MRRALLAFLLSFLLLGMQQQAAVHALDHLGARHEHGATTPQNGVPCATCELLASGANGIPASALSASAASGSAAIEPVQFATRPVSAPACYSSRAPPAFS